MSILNKQVIVLTLLTLCFSSVNNYSQETKTGDFKMIVSQFSTAPFPHPQRKNGHSYQGKVFPADVNYSDSSVLLCVPKTFKPGGKTNYIVYFHGWYNNIDTAVKQFSLIDQFISSELNAIFVFPEGPKNAPDSFGGKLGDKNGFAAFMTEVAACLKANGVDAGNTGKIMLAGHSGAYHVISRILFHGGMTDNISDVILFDALYGQTEKYIHWVENTNGKLVNIYTDGGGTKSESELMMEDLKQWNIPIVNVEEDNCTDEIIRRNRLIFIHTSLTHNEVIAARKQFLKFLKNSSLAN